ncbi:MAG: ATP-binding protein [Planctomycetota bacterium]
MKAEPTAATDDKVNVLLVDDQPENLLALRSTLEGIGQNLVTARSGREALKYLLTHDCALIILDVLMPEIDGFETAQLIREREACRQIPIIFLTAGDRNDDKVFKGYSVGAVDYLHKPFNMEVLRSKTHVFVELAKKTELIKKQERLLRESEKRDHEREIEETKRRHEAESYRIKGELLLKEMEAAKARAALELAETRAHLLGDLEKKNAELERAKLQAERESSFKSKFLAGMSHELRTPLNAIIGFSEMLEQELFGSLNERQKEYVGLVLQSGRHLLALVNDILDISKVEAGRMSLDRERMSFDKVVASVADITRALAVRQGVTLDLGVPRGLPEIDVDLLRMKQVLYNLLSNAIKFTPAGGVVVLTARTSGAELEFSIEDSGIGIKPEDLPRLFHEFEQIEVPKGALPVKPEGTGLGLALTKRLVALHGGTIAIESEPQRGTRVRVRVPLADAPVRAGAAKEVRR